MFPNPVRANHTHQDSLQGIPCHLCHMKPAMEKLGSALRSMAVETLRCIQVLKPYAFGGGCEAVR